MAILRDYQRQAIEAAWTAITPDQNRVAIEMATGLGKTVTFAGLIDEWLDKDRQAWTEVAACGEQVYPARALVLVHTDKLVRQAVATIKTVTRGRWTVGVVKAEQNETGADIIVASVQTLAKPGRREQIQDVGLIVVDECHHATAVSYTMILRHFKAMCTCLPYEAGGDGPERECPSSHGDGSVLPVPTFGFTATLARSDGTGLGHVWQDLAFSRNLLWGIRHGYLVDMVPYSILIPGVNGAASDQALDAQLADSIAPEAVVEAWKDRHIEGGGLSVGPLPSTLLFAPLVRSAEAFAEAFNAAGVKAEVVAGEYGDAHNHAVEQRYAAGITTVVCNAMMWTEGVDFPRTSCVVIARPTKSKPLMVQMAGRGLRPWLESEAPAREDQRCTLLVVAGAETDFLSMVADLSDEIAEAAAGKSLTAMADEFDLGKDIPPDEDQAYRGPVRVEQWDALVQRSSKAWKYTAGGTPFLPLARKADSYVFIVETGEGSEVWSMLPGMYNDFRTDKPRKKFSKLATAPDLELAMALAEDQVSEGIGTLLVEKSRAWRKAVPSLEMQAQARRVGVDESAIARILSLKTSGKAGKLSDLIDKAVASRVLDHNVEKIKRRARS